MNQTRHTARIALRARSAATVCVIALAGWAATVQHAPQDPPGQPAEHRVAVTSPSASDSSLVARSGRTHRRHSQGAQHVSFGRVRTTRSAMPWEGLPGYPGPTWNGSVESLDRFIHLSGLLIGAALVLGGFHRDRRRDRRAP